MKCEVKRINWFDTVKYEKKMFKWWLACFLTQQNSMLQWQYSIRKTFSVMMWMTLQRWKRGQWDLHHVLIAPRKFYLTEQCLSQTEIFIRHCQITKRNKHCIDTDKFISQAVGICVTETIYSQSGPIRIALDNRYSDTPICFRACLYGKDKNWKIHSKYWSPLIVPPYVGSSLPQTA